MATDRSRRALLAASGTALAGLTGCLSRLVGVPTPQATSTPTPAAGTSTPVSVCSEPLPDRFSDDGPTTDPRPQPCPEKPVPIEPCPARDYAVGLERHLAYGRAFDGYVGVESIEFRVAPPVVRPAETGIIVHSAALLRGTAEAEAGETPSSGSLQESFREPYSFSYHVHPAGTWRAVGESGSTASERPREDGEQVSCR